jgi:serine/threonine-protein kinase RsbW
MRKVHLTLSSQFDNIDLVDHVTEACLHFAGFDEGTTEHMTLAIREAAANAIKHGNKQHPDKITQVIFELDEENIHIEISDQGDGFRPEEVPNPLAPENLLKGTGRGIFLMRQLMDDVNFAFAEEGGTRVMLRKRIPGQAAAHQEEGEE